MLNTYVNHAIVTAEAASAMHAIHTQSCHKQTSCISTVHARQARINIQHASQLQQHDQNMLRISIASCVMRAEQ